MFECLQWCSNLFEHSEERLRGPGLARVIEGTMMCNCYVKHLYLYTFESYTGFVFLRRLACKVSNGCVDTSDSSTNHPTQCEGEQLVPIGINAFVAGGLKQSNRSHVIGFLLSLSASGAGHLKHSRKGQNGTEFHIMGLPNLQGKKAAARGNKFEVVCSQCQRIRYDDTVKACFCCRSTGKWNGFCCSCSGEKAALRTTTLWWEGATRTIRGKHYYYGGVPSDDKPCIKTIKDRKWTKRQSQSRKKLH